MFGRRSARVQRRSGWRFAYVRWVRTRCRIEFTGRIAGLRGSLVGLLAAVVHQRRHRPSVPFGPGAYSWPPEPCVVHGIDARCGTFVVPENRTKPNGRTIGLNVVVLPCVLEAGPTRRGHLSRWRAGGRGHRARGDAEPATDGCSTCIATSCSSTSGGPGRSKPAPPRRDAVRDADGDGRPGCGAGCARLPAARRDRQLLRSDSGTGLREAASLLGAHARPRGRDCGRCPLLRPLRRQRPARPRPARRGAARRSPNAGRRSPAGSVNSASSCRLGTPIRCTARVETSSPPSST